MTIVAAPSAAIELCVGGNRAARQVTCLVDGDTGWENGVKWRLVDIDAPEISKAECAEEIVLGEWSVKRLMELMSGGYTIERSGAKDRTRDRRELVRVILPDGRDAGRVLLSEGLAQRWPNKGNRWCRVLAD
ncbi:MAG: thermonuclease family protein [Shinella sp.]|nr:thermonuclease family protein [Shinella sp.]